MTHAPLVTLLQYSCMPPIISSHHMNLFKFRQYSENGMWKELVFFRIALFTIVLELLRNPWFYGRLQSFVSGQKLVRLYEQFRKPGLTWPPVRYFGLLRADGLDPRDGTLIAREVCRTIHRLMPQNTFFSRLREVRHVGTLDRWLSIGTRSLSARTFGTKLLVQRQKRKLSRSRQLKSLEKC